MSLLLYLEHLTDADLGVLSAVADEAASDADLLTKLHSEPEHLETLLGRPSLFTLLFAKGDGDILLRASPFLAFAVLVRRATQDLEHARFVDEWVGPGRRVPMFEVAGLQDFASDPQRRLFLAELLASYTRVASGSVWVQTSRGWRRRRFSELDPMHLVELVQVVPERERSAVYRRLGDLALFLTGVFPDYAGRNLVAPIQRRRLGRALGLGDIDRSGFNLADSSGSISLLEQVGRRSYYTAWKATEGIGGSMSRVLGEVADGFGQARRILNFLTDRYLFPFRDQWFPLPEA
jgi:hypothetical protein